MEQTLQEFRKAHTSKERKVTVTGSWGVKQAWRLIRKNHWFDLPRPVNEHEFYSILRAVNLRLANELALGHTIHFPSKMGSLELRKYAVGVSITDGKLKNTYPIDWGETWKLWYNDAEAYDKKIIMRQETPYRYHVKYLKDKANYENKKFYLFQLNQKIKQQLKKNIKNGITDTLW